MEATIHCSSDPGLIRRPRSSEDEILRPRMHQRKDPTARNPERGEAWVCTAMLVSGFVWVLAERDGEANKLVVSSCMLVHLTGLDSRANLSSLTTTIHASSSHIASCFIETRFMYYFSWPDPEDVPASDHSIVNWFSYVLNYNYSIRPELFVL